MDNVGFLGIDGTKDRDKRPYPKVESNTSRDTREINRDFSKIHDFKEILLLRLAQCQHAG